MYDRDDPRVVILKNRRFIWMMTILDEIASRGVDSRRGVYYLISVATANTCFC